MKMLTLFAMLFSVTAFAAKGENFEENKAKAIARLDQRISMLQEAKTCISSAADKDALKACHKKHKESRQAFADDRKEKKEARKAKRAERKKNKSESED
jgi:hypothetical protein